MLIVFGKTEDGYDQRLAKARLLVDLMPSLVTLLHDG
jgi:hypothetical protein